MKRIIEVKRGEPVPSNAKWLKDKVLTFYDYPVCPCHSFCVCSPEYTYTTYDVFEVAEESEVHAGNGVYFSKDLFK